MQLKGKVSQQNSSGATVAVSVAGNEQLYQKAGHAIRLPFDESKIEALRAAKTTTVTLKVTSVHDLGPANMVIASAIHTDLVAKRLGDQVIYYPLTGVPAIGDEITLELEF